VGAAFVNFLPRQFKEVNNMTASEIVLKDQTFNEDYGPEPNKLSRRVNTAVHRVAVKLSLQSNCTDCRMHSRITRRAISSTMRAAFQPAHGVMIAMRGEPHRSQGAGSRGLQ